LTSGQHKQHVLLGLLMWQAERERCRSLSFTPPALRRPHIPLPRPACNN